jgi:hypothetical protein
MRRVLIAVTALLCVLVSAPPAMASIASVRNDSLTVTGAPAARWTGSR